MAKAVGTTPKQLLPCAKVRASLPDSTCAVLRHWPPAGANPARRTVVPAGSNRSGSWRQRHGLKHSAVKGSPLGGSASMQAGIRGTPSRPRKSRCGGRPADVTGKAVSGREASDARTGRLRRGTGDSMPVRGGRRQHGKPRRWCARAKPESRKGQAGPVRVAERSVLPERPGNAGGGKGAQVRRGE